MDVDRQQKAAAAEAAAEAAQKESADAFRGLHLDPKAHHWDEVRPIPNVLIHKPGYLFAIFRPSIIY
jgi:isopenicillin N synthase-like dioxygenase